ncbi:MAG TPA: DNA repair protein RecN [Xanthomonadales bacterium]|nr:DNA repair protein RecN [Xanthomonadales bacterium]
MLRSLVVKDFAIIDAAELALGAGMTALTGETGAGKSLIVDALMLLGGARADAGFVRHGCERAELAAEFDLAHATGVKAWLRELELDDGDECRVRRVLRADGSSRAFVNDSPVTVQTLKDLCAQLVEIHGQHEHQALLQRSRQLLLLDAYGNHDAQRAQVAEHARAWSALEAEASALEARAGGGGQGVDFLRFQLDELAKHALEPAALEALEAEHRRLSHGGELLAGCASALDALDGDRDGAIRPQLARVAADLERLQVHDERLAPVVGLLRDASVAVDEACEQLERRRDDEGVDPDRLAKLDATLARLHDLSRKHRVPVAGLKAREQAVREEYEALAGADERLAALRARQARVLADYDAAAAQLTHARAKAAATLGAAVTALMGELGMGGGRFAIAIETTTDGAPTGQGRDAVEFTVSANPGQPLRALRKIASGGELARIGLAIEVAALGKDDVATMVFDEVDAGIGGAVAEVVGRKLKALGRERQVLCVTHLPQVAAQAHRHVAVSKQRGKDETRTDVAMLDEKRRLEEIARMLGGVEITTATREHARQMLEASRDDLPDGLDARTGREASRRK